MSYKKRSRSSHRSKKRGLARAGAALLIRGIASCLRSQDAKTKTTSRTQTRKRPTKAKSPGRSPRNKGLARSQRGLVKLAKAQQSGVMVQLDARVVKILPDDTYGDQHQRFIIAIDNMRSPIRTVLIAHNIDLAPRVPVERGSVARFYGQYEWNERGGLLHWTHHDPSNWREGGWIELHGKRYD